MAVAAASFNTVILCTRSILKSLIVSKSDSNPSRINKGWFGSVSYSSVKPTILLLPRISILGKWLGSEPNSLFSIMANEGSRVFKLCNTLWFPTILSSFEVKVVVDPVKFSFLRVKIPFTTTSSISAISSSRTICKFSCPVYFTSCSFIPTNENTRIISFWSGISNLKFPSASVTPPSVVPFNITVTPGSFPPLVSDTTPCTVLTFWGTAGAAVFGAVLIRITSSSKRQVKWVPSSNCLITSSTPASCTFRSLFPHFLSSSTRYKNW